jgi:hypothetical protein
MKTVFSHIEINYSEYQYFLDLNSPEQLQYLFDVYDAEIQGKSGLDLSNFFDTVKQTIIENSEPIQETYNEYELGVERVDVMIDDETIMIETNNLKALRHVIFKFIETGYIIQRDIVLEKMVRKDKMTKYLRIFRIINQSTGLCFN